MSKVLVTGGSGFIASHILNVLLARNHTVVTTVRSKAKGDQVLEKHSSVAKGRLSYVIVDDISREGAFDTAVQSDPAFDYVIHTASPFPDSFDDPVKDLLNPAVNGTTGIMKAIKAHAPQVRRVVITSSFASMANEVSAPKVYDESSWNPVTWEQGVTDRSKTYRASKTYAEKAAWEFVETQKPNFDLTTVCPPLVFGPVTYTLAGLNGLNTSNQRIRDFIQDVRDLALAHVKAIEVPEAGGKRFFLTAGHYSSKRMVDAIRATKPELSSRLPPDPIDDSGDCTYGYDNTRAREILGINFLSFEECIKDTTNSLIELGAADSKL